MTFLNLCSNSLILSVAFTLLISGVIVFLMNTKISRLEKNIQKQNQALADMINHIKADVNMINTLPPQIFNGEEAMNVAENPGSTNKIQVSSDSETDTDSDDDSDSDSGSDAETESSKHVGESTEISVQEDTLKTINLSALSNDANSSGVTSTINVVEEVSNSSSESDSSDDDSSDDDNAAELQKVLDKVSTETNVDIVSVEKLASNETEKQTSSAKQPGLTKLKVTELKDLALDGKLASPTAVAEMKKKDLIELLRSQ